MKIEGQPKLELEVTIRINESEARALEALAGYGADAFVKGFYSILGETYMKPHEGGLRSLLKTIREEMPTVLTRMTDVRDVWRGRKVAEDPQ